MNKLPPEEYYKSLPRKRGSAGVLFFREGKLLVLEPTYKDGLEIPAGVINKDESPVEAAIRECQEEIGVTPEITQFLCADYRRGDAIMGDSIHYIFLGEMGDQEVRIDNDEIGGFRWLPVPEALAEIAATRPAFAARIGASISAINKGAVYCEEGKPVVPPSTKPPRV
jgi:8-oxo-dGTP diphosphatase